MVWSSAGDAEPALPSGRLIADFEAESIGKRHGAGGEARPRGRRRRNSETCHSRGFCRTTRSSCGAVAPRPQFPLNRADRRRNGTVCKETEMLSRVITLGSESSARGRTHSVTHVDVRSNPASSLKDSDEDKVWCSVPIGDASRTERCACKATAVEGHVVLRL